MPERIAVIGGGIAGLTAARQLAAEGLDVTVVDKSRNPGGRCATRTSRRHTEEANDSAAEHLQFDHGAQYFTCRDDRFQTRINDWLDRNVVAPWTGKLVQWSAGSIEPINPATVRYVGVPGMNAVGADLARGLRVLSGVLVGAIEAMPEGWMLGIHGAPSIGPFHTVIVNTPPVQAAALLPAELLHDSSASANRLQEIRMAPSWSVMLAFDERLPVEYDGAFITDMPLSWIARDSSKPGRPAGERWVLHAAADWSTTHLETDSDRVIQLLIESWQALTGTQTPPSHVRAHRWRCALPTDPLNEGCIWDAPNRIGICGDWCCGARVEGAYLSGLAIAERVRT